jgi:hypothetical protein
VSSTLRSLLALLTLASLAIVCSALWEDLVHPLMTKGPLGPSAAGLLVIGLGLPLFLLFRLRARS